MYFLKNDFTHFVIPDLMEPALACPVLDTGYLTRPQMT
jgi:hypothetical protein